MLKMRMLKPGKSVKRTHHYKIVVIEEKSARDARFVEELGFYDASREIVKLDTEIYDKWYKLGARPSATVAGIYKKIKKTQAK